MFFRRRHFKRTKLFVSLGAGFNQIPLIKEAKKAGFNVIGIDKNPSAAGLLDCDLRIQESMYNHEDIYRKIQELLLDGDIKGALTRSYGEAIRSAAHLNESLGVKYIPLSSIDALIDKKKMKTVLEKNDIQTPSAAIITSAGQIKKFPVVLKPVSGHAKHGVAYIEDAKSAREYLENCEKSESGFLCERYIDGDEIIASGIVIDGKFTLIEITDKITTPLPRFVDIQHSAPSKYASKWTEIEELGSNIARAFDISTSPLLFEARIDKDGGIFVIEVIPEFGGEFLADQLIPLHTGYNFILQSILAITGNPALLPIPKKYKGAVVVKYIVANKTGTLTSITPVSRKSSRYPFQSTIFKDVGASVSSPENNHDRIGVIIVKAKSVEEAAAAAEEIEKMYSIKIREKKKK
jgi:biotin carboxylase